jgi:hypothetical protein
MSTTLDQLKSTLSSLPAAERAELADYLLLSLDEGEIHEGEIHAEWLAVAESRMEDVRAGRVVGIPAKEFLDSLLEPEK